MEAEMRHCGANPHPFEAGPDATSDYVGDPVYRPDGHWWNNGEEEFWCPENGKPKYFNENLGEELAKIEKNKKKNIAVTVVLTETEYKKLWKKAILDTGNIEYIIRRELGLKQQVYGQTTREIISDADYWYEQHL